MEQTPPKEPETGNSATEAEKLIGGSLMLEGVTILIASLPLVLLGGLGLFGMAAGGALIWSGAVLIGETRAAPQLAFIVTLIAGVLAVFITLMASTIMACASIMNCGSVSGTVWIASAIVAVLNIIALTMLARRAADPR